MRTSTKVMVVLGVVSGFGASLIPLGSLAALDPTATTSDDTANVTLNASINEVNGISVGAASTSMTVTPNSTTPATPASPTVITAISNHGSGYNVTVASTSATAQLVNSTNSGTPIPSSANVGSTDQSGVVQNAWGIKTAVTGYTDTWQAIPGSAGSLLAATKSDVSSVNGDAYNINWGVTVNGNIIAGNYSDTVRFTISPKA